MPPRTQRDEALQSLTAKIVSSLVDDLVLDAVLQAHHEVAKSKAVCTVCNTRCNAGIALYANFHSLLTCLSKVHVPKPSPLPPHNPSASSRAVTPATFSDKGVNGSGSNGTSTPTVTNGDGTLYLDCVNCSRPIASTRYAPHLASCMGLSTARRGGVRSNAKPKHPSEADRSASPMSDAGNISDDKSPKKLLSKSKRADEAEFSYKRKRPASPQISPNKTSPHKKQKSSGKPSGSPVARVKASTNVSPSRSSAPPIGSTSSSLSKVPSKLRDSSTAPYLDPASVTSSRSSSPAVTPVSSSFSVHTNGSVKGPHHIPHRPVVSHYMLDDDAGNETGSSTDTDSS